MYCDKIAYKSKKAATLTLLKLRAQGRVYLESYRCIKCNKIHLGNNRRIKRKLP